jgi:hypothetical protein
MTLSAPFEIVAHALVGRRDLPIPEWLFAWAASLVLIVSFVALSMAWHRSRFEGSEWRPVPAWLSRALINGVTEVIAGALGVFLLGVVIWAGLKGTEAPDRNFSLTFVFYTVWIGVVFVSVFAGDVFRAFNPWRAIARAIGGVFRLAAGQSQPPPLRYPERLGRWPAVGAILGFVVLELVFGASGFGTLPGLTPHRVAIATIVYTVYTLIAMALFGREEWLARGEGFSVYFGMFASLSPLEVRDRALGTRRWLSAATRWVDSPGSVALILVAIGSTTFDGAGEGVLSTPITNLYNSLNDAGLSPATALRLDNAIFFAATLAFVFGLFWAGIYGMHTVKESFSTRRLGDLFGHAFISIALAYVVAHYFSALVDQEQAQFGFLLSDPLGDGSDYFGTAGSGINYGVISATAVWYIQVAALVSGHVIALVLGHDRALRVYGDTRTAARSQYWMLALMVGFTSLGLYLLSQSNA